MWSSHTRSFLLRNSSQNRYVGAMLRQSQSQAGKPSLAQIVHSVYVFIDHHKWSESALMNTVPDWSTDISVISQGWFSHFLLPINNFISIVQKHFWRRGAASAAGNMPHWACISWTYFAPTHCLRTVFSKPTVFNCSRVITQGDHYFILCLDCLLCGWTARCGRIWRHRAFWVHARLA